MTSVRMERRVRERVNCAIGVGRARNGVEIRMWRQREGSYYTYMGVGGGVG